MASRSTAKLLRIIKTDESEFKSTWSTICGRRESAGQNVEKQAAAIIARVREGGDEELLACVKQYDGAKLKSLEVGRDEWDEACEQVEPGDRAALGKAAMRVRDFHRKRIPSSWEMREEGGAYMGTRVRPLERVGIYVPGGKAVYPSSVIMNAVPA